jgi:hypothetical protein
MGRDEEWLKARIEAYHDAALAYAAVKLGLPERLADGPVPADALAAELELSQPHLQRCLRGLASIGICEELADGRFGLTALGHSLRKGSASRLGEKVEIVVGQYWLPWAELLATLETGKPAFEHVFGMDVGAWRRQTQEDGATFNAYLAAETLANAAPVVEALDLSGAATVADIGGGHGGLLAAILKAHPRLQGVLFDVPETVEGALPFLQAHGVAERVRRAGGDPRANIPVEADIYLLNGVLQQCDDKNAAAILKACRKAMQPGARLIIIERLMPERAADDPAAVMLDLHMMTIHGGRLRTQPEFEALLRQAGLALSGAKTTPTGLTIIEAVRA